MRVREKYSIVISLLEKDVSSIKDMKMLLYNNIGKFGSQNSEAHISMVNFIADPTELNKVIIYLEAFCLSSSFKDISFISLDSFPSTLYLGASSDTHEWFKALVKRFSKHFPLNKTTCKFKTTIIPHITIGRDLDALRITRACYLFENQKVDFAFQCKGVTMRKLNPTVGQYETLSHHLFGNKTDLYLEDQQLSLF